MDLFTGTQPTFWPTLEEWVSRSDLVFVKKLSRNDQSWADDAGKHQAGFYIPRDIRDSGFFPALVADNPEKPHIFHAAIPSTWPQTGEHKPSHIRHFSNKGSEMHFTVVPKEVFSGLSPASLLVCGRLRHPVAEARYWLAVLDSNGEDAEILETVLELPSTFHYGLFEPDRFRTAQLLADEAAELIDRIKHAIATGTLDRFIATDAKMPAPERLAADAQQVWLSANGRTSLDPFLLDSPGDALMQISRDVEYSLFRKHERNRRAAEVVRVLMASPGDLVEATVRRFADLDAIFLSASQQRKTRAGRSFEQHIERMLVDGGIRFAPQAVLGGRRPDFVIPDVHTLTRKDRDREEAIVLSAKTTLRERWKQVRREKFDCDVYLATVDDRVPTHVIEALKGEGIQLVVPETLKNSNESCYPKSTNVISFDRFFSVEIGERRPMLLGRFGIKSTHRDQKADQLK